MRQHFYRIPKSAIGAYNSAELTLNISYDELITYEEKNEDKGMLESITGSIKDKTKSIKEKTVDKLDDDEEEEEHQQQMKRKRFDQDIQTSTNTKNLNRENQEKEINRNIDTGEKLDETSMNVESSYSSYSCEKCNTKFTSRQELKEHFSSKH